MKRLGMFFVISIALTASFFGMAKPTQDAPAPGGGPGKVWVSQGSKVYHCQNDQWYGRTKSGEYMKEEDAKAKGYHGARGKSC